MGGGDYHLGKKGPLFVRRLSVLGCSQFPQEQKKGKRGAPEKKKWRERMDRIPNLYVISDTCLLAAVLEGEFYMRSLLVMGLV